MRLGYVNGKPALPVTFVGDGGSVEVIALIDSGADYCTLPLVVCKDIGLRRVGVKSVVVPGITTSFEEYSGKVKINGFEFNDIGVLAVDLSTPEIDALIGRNVPEQIEDRTQRQR